jgi:hypothetical protein
MMMGPLFSLLLAANTVQASSAFVLKPEWKGPCQASKIVDVNLGNTTRTFIRDCYCQIQGKEPSASFVQVWEKHLAATPNWRRVDVVRTMAKGLGHQVKLAYSDPWANDPELPAAGPKGNHRDIGAITMFFFNCPGGVNCGMDWANNHVLGMEAPAATLAFQGKPGFYTPDQAGFWLHELRDARAAGLDFLLPNVYGPDMDKGQIQTLAQALAVEATPVKVALLDDTWTWGEQWFGPKWQVRPDLSDPTRASAKLYDAKWKPFFTQIPRASWYLVDGKPLIYFYNGGKLLPLLACANTLRRMKQRFKADFGVEPFLCADQAYFADPEMENVADERFIWNPLNGTDTPDPISWSHVRGKALAHAIVRWDAVGRDKPGQVAGPGDRLMKGPEKLAQILSETEHADILVLATWNDLGEGTGLNRCYDYWYQDHWMQPDAFIQMLRQAHEQ